MWFRKFTKPAFIQNQPKNRLDESVNILHGPGAKFTIVGPLA